MSDYTVLPGDCLTTLRTLPESSVHCVVTSPPYYGLRDYGTAQWEGGDPECDHVDPQGAVNAPSAKSTLTTNNGKGPQPGDKYHTDRTAQYSHTCGKCGAIRIDSQIGLEPTPAAYVARLVDVFREVWRVLRPDGVVWLNLGDSYAGSTIGGGDGSRSGLVGTHHAQRTGTGNISRRDTGLKPKDLIGIPWRVAFALQDDGWWLRSDIIWHKPNPMPESVTDRPTKAHEYIFLLAKSERYFYDAEAIKEKGSGKSCGNKTYKYDGVPGHETKQGILSVSDVEWYARNRRSVWTVATPMCRLRSDLTPEQRAYVLQRIAAEG